MLKIKSFLLIICGMIALFFLFPFTGLTNFDKSSDDLEKRPDRILIQLSADETKLELPAVAFMHDIHTQALNGDCAACHKKEESAFVFKFMRTSEPADKELYHQNCVACHDEKKAGGDVFGPSAGECRACHTEKPRYGSSWKPIEFDRSLHVAHERSKMVTALDKKDTDNCSRCHHQANMKSKEIFYVKGEESACSYCHTAETEEGLRNARQASHDSCVVCHQQLKDAKKEAGPVNCRGCHDEGQQMKIKKMTDLPRLKRNQPDMVTIAGWNEGAKERSAFMPAVGFNHELHEKETLSCKACHHQTLKKCSDCHTPEGNNADGGYVSLETAMHSPESSRSCIGCHKAKTQSSDCAGCHAAMPANNKKDAKSCKSCHAIAPETVTADNGAMLAQKTLAQRKADYTRVSVDQIPEIVTIDILAKDYKASRFPHRKVVLAIFERVEKSGMARMFHEDQSAMCMGCHHNSPKSLTPPKCASCHSKKGPAQDGRPGLKGAYHGQCISCHQKMEVEMAATDCAKCHEANK